MHDDLKLCNYSEHTIHAYLHCIAEFARHFHTSPEHLRPEHVCTYQFYLVQQKHMAWGTFKHIVCALRFFFQMMLGVSWLIEHIPSPRRQQKLPTALSRSQGAALLMGPRNLKYWAMIATLYAAGLRVSELCTLQVTDIESQRMVIRVRQGRGQRDHLVMLSPRLLPTYLEADSGFLVLLHTLGSAAALPSPSPMTLDAVECLRRFLLHVLPRGFQHIRYYGFLADRVRQEQLSRCRWPLQSSAPLSAVVAPVAVYEEATAAAMQNRVVCLRHRRL
jgi:integrase